jgi:RES domain-containing protein
VTEPPATSLIRRNDTHRLIPSKYSDDGGSDAQDALASSKSMDGRETTVFTRIARNDAHLKDIFDLDGATNDPLLAENQMLPGIGLNELVFGVPCSRIVNAAFTHAHPLGSRFNSPERGAWYAAFEIQTAQAEVAFHKSVDLAEIGRFEDEVTLDDYLADFSASFHDLRNNHASAACLDPDSYMASQALAEHLLQIGSLGIAYPSVRHVDGTCLACFRPALVMNVRKDATYRFTWSGDTVPSISPVSQKKYTPNA